MISINIITLIFLLDIIISIIPMVIIRKRKINKSLILGVFWFLGMTMLWSFVNLLISSGWINNFTLYYSLSNIFSYFMCGLVLYLALTLRERGKTVNYHNIVLFLPIAICSILILIIPDNPLPQFIDHPLGIVIQVQPEAITPLLNLLMSLLYLPLSAVIFIHNIKNNTNRNTQYSSLVLLIMVLVGTLLTSISFLILAPMGIPPMLSFAISPMIYSIGVIIILLRYGFLQDEPRFLLDKIWDSIGESIILVDMKGRINKLNKKAEQCFPHIISGEMSYQSLFNERNEIDERINMLNTEDSRQNLLVKINTEDNDDLINLSIQKLTDRHDDQFGYILILSEGPRYSEFKVKYGLTPKQWEISLLLIKGLGYQEIADQQFISFYTVKNHVHQVYSKTGCKSRHELINLLLSH